MIIIYIRNRVMIEKKDHFINIKKKRVIKLRNVRSRKTIWRDNTNSLQ